MIRRSGEGLIALLIAVAGTAQAKDVYQTPQAILMLLLTFTGLGIWISRAKRRTRSSTV